MILYGPDGKPITVTSREVAAAPSAPVITRQMKCAYLRSCAMTVINQVAGGEPRRIRRAMARERAKRPTFIEQVRNASKAW